MFHLQGKAAVTNENWTHRDKIVFDTDLRDNSQKNPREIKPENERPTPPRGVERLPGGEKEKINRDM